MDITELFKQLAEYTRMQEEAAAIVDGLKDQIKDMMTTQRIEELTGNEHKATYKPVTSSRLDGKALKADFPDIYAKYTTSTTSMRFNFA